MATTSRKVMLYCVIAVTALAVYELDTRVRKAGIHWIELGGAVYKRFRPSECSIDDIALPPPSDTTLISMKDSSEFIVQNLPIKSFALSVSDLNGDGDDDILIGAHENNPFLFVNTGSGFNNMSQALFPEPQELDRHGYTLADLDNDGDLDVAIAGGGEDGIGAGVPNLFLRNETENGSLKFVAVQVSNEMAEPSLRSRSLMPVSSDDGKAIDLYFTALLRNGFPNKLFRNTRSESAFKFEPEDSFLSMSINDHGRGVLADFDGDGNNDYLVIEDWRLVIYWHPNSNRRRTILSYRAFSTSVGDFNNDGKLDVFLGTFSAPSQSDNLAHDSEELIYVIKRNAVDDSNSIVFESRSSLLEFNLNQHVQATMPRPFTGGEDIYLGHRKSQPESRIFAIEKQQALGAPPAFDEPGTYIWYSESSQQWNMKWVFYDVLDEFKGAVKGTDIANVVKTNFTKSESEMVLDAVFINQGDGSFSELCTGFSAHTGATSDSTIADFNNDGWLDIIGLRQGEQGTPNGDLFVLTNNSGNTFFESHLALREMDKLKNADLIAHGFFDQDDNPDIVLTNGYGQVPANDGSPRLMLNTTSSRHQALLINLEGTNANKFGIGASLTLTDANDNVIGFRTQGLNSNITQDTHWIHFGLAQHPAPFLLRVDWPDGATTNYSFSGPGRYPAKQ